MSNVYLISASINEKGTTTGGKPGNQGNELKRRLFYNHSKGWILLRPVFASDAEKIAQAAEAAYTNKNFGYCQTHRLSGFNEAAKVGYDPAKVSTPVEIDCSELVRLCIYYAGIYVPDFNTATEKAVLISTGMFIQKEYSNKEELKAGDILVTKTKGHTEIVVTTGSKAEVPTVNWYQEFVHKCKDAMLSDDFVNQTRGDVKALQYMLKYFGFDPGDIDGRFGDNTEIALRNYQLSRGLHVCGVFNSSDYVVMLRDYDGSYIADKCVYIIGDCWLRTGPGIAYTKYAVMKKGSNCRYITKDGEWYYVKDANGVEGYVSSKYAEVH